MLLTQRETFMGLGDRHFRLMVASLILIINANIGPRGSLGRGTDSVLRN
jgi:hypothetical protein